jgi:putative restriction endonuclease
MKKLESYLERFAKLRSDSNRSRWPATTYYRAPHKPVLLLAVMDLIAEGTVSANLIEITPDLGELFTLYWSRVMQPDQRGNLALPSFTLKAMASGICCRNLARKLLSKEVIRLNQFIGFES